MIVNDRIRDNVLTRLAGVKSAHLVFCALAFILSSVPLNVSVYNTVNEILKGEIHD